MGSDGVARVSPHPPRASRGSPPSPASGRGNHAADGEAPLLEVRELRTHFAGDGGWMHAVDGVSFAIRAGTTLGLVGESGCGKSVTSLSIMGLVPQPPGRIAGGEVLFQGEDLLTLPSARLRDLRGNEIAMIFQEPMTS